MSTLVNAVLAQLGHDEMTQEALDELKEVAIHGADCGFGGFIYYHETVEFAKENLSLIKDWLKQDSEDFDRGLLEFVASFNCLKGDFSADEIAEATLGDNGYPEVYNALAWYALEKVAQEAEYEYPDYQLEETE